MLLKFTHLNALTSRNPEGYRNKEKNQKEKAQRMLQ